jgi:hypothetical protein
MSLSDAELERYARHIVLPRFGGAQNRLKAAKRRTSELAASAAGRGAGRSRYRQTDHHRQ